ncbi:uncharacterized protein CANTADRAFT_24337 [Suhomyces tanzawaensis NRRL Y-17324]|uniref:Cohesin loading factor n=1 Tax=Suhomyces tanzawaensis NRRL Y-17324 TaxID=984487 RepID=A0A1E4SPC4_9ASCO|nr:uncharacterized protein CANTADRAFT_24337 [Suhomyces tanzawaensis NRRL Y-17324]ODV81363.1 hypothetical protein CANTADRAFT_24337 [Suhomyces tanzawaensis NRRL Y-17324]
MTDGNGSRYQNLFQEGFLNGLGAKKSPSPDQSVQINSAVLSKFMETPAIPKKRHHQQGTEEHDPSTSYTADHNLLLSNQNPQTHEIQPPIPVQQFHPETTTVPLAMPAAPESVFAQLYHPLYGQPIHAHHPALSLVDNSAPGPDLIIQNLLMTAEFFTSKAHSIVLSTSTFKGSQDYYKMIKIAIKALVMLSKRYARYLDPWLELIVYFKLAKLYFTETENIHRAEEYINRAMAISSRNNLVPIQVLSEFLAGQILEVVNHNLLANYLDNKIQHYSQMGYRSYSDMFLLLKLNNSLVTDIDTGLILLQNISHNVNINPLTRLLALIYQSNLHLYRGSPRHSASSLTEAESILNGFPVGTIPTQFTAMAYLLRYLNSIQTNDILKAKESMLLISSYLNSQQSLGWNLWQEDGTFTIITGDINYKICWLSSDEFVIMFYYLTGVHLLTEVSNGKKKAKKVFDKCLQIIEKQLREVEGLSESRRSFSMHKLHQVSIRLRYIKYNIHYYQSWMGFLNNDFNDINYLNEFMSDYNNDNLKEDEVYFRDLLPKVFYLFAAYYQFKGDIQASKYYYMKVRNLTNSAREPLLNQLDLGIGGYSIHGVGEFNELFVYATLHLLILNEFEAGEISKVSQDKSSSLISEYFKVRGQLHADLTKAFAPKTTSNGFAINFTGSNDLLKLTYHLLLNIFNDRAVSGEQHQQQESTNKVLIEQMGQIMENFRDATSFPFITNLINYLIYIGTDNVDQKNKSLEKCMAMISISSGSDNDRIISIFVLKSLIQHFWESGENDKASMAEMQLEYFYNTVGPKFDFLRGNIES